MSDKPSLQSKTFHQLQMTSELTNQLKIQKQGPITQISGQSLHQHDVRIRKDSHKPKHTLIE